jgi:parallel beta-helix repeat protein
MKFLRGRHVFGLSTLGFLLVSGVASAKTVAVTDVATLTAAIAAAAPGDEIVMADGTYHFTSSPVCSAAGTAAQPIRVHAAHPLAAKVEFDAVEGFHVTGPYWRFEGLDVHGVCAVDSNCEHAFHVTGAAKGFVLSGNRLVDFNAQLKVNADLVGQSYVMPNGGLVEGNVVFDTHSRATSNPVTKLNIDTVDDWVVRANFIHDGHKNGGDGVSYQSFIKGGGKNGLYERNLVICTLDETSGGTRIGLSFGGGGTGAQFCAPAFNAAVPCSVEHTGGTMRNNIIVNCSDVGIYLNQSKDTHLLSNTLVATNGVDFRFANSSGEADGNLLASVIRTRDGAAFTAKTNLLNATQPTFDGWFLDAMHGDLRKKGDQSALIGKATLRADVPDDYCARARTGTGDMGALQVSLGDCSTTMPPLGGGAPDAGGGGLADGGGGTGSGGGSGSGSGGGADGGGVAPCTSDAGNCTASV